MVVVCISTYPEKHPTVSIKSLFDTSWFSHHLTPLIHLFQDDCPSLMMIYIPLGWIQKCFHIDPWSFRFTFEGHNKESHPCRESSHNQMVLKQTHTFQFEVVRFLKCSCHLPSISSCSKQATNIDRYLFIQPIVFSRPYVRFCFTLDKTHYTNRKYISKALMPTQTRWSRTVHGLKD
jgi:hypothetical protein